MYAAIFIFNGELCEDFEEADASARTNFEALLAHPEVNSDSFLAGSDVRQSAVRSEIGPF